MDIEREILETDILIVGAGPAGLALAYKLASLVSEDDSVDMPEKATRYSNFRSTCGSAIRVVRQT